MVGPQWDNEHLDLHQIVCIGFHVHQIPKWIWDPTEEKTAGLDFWCHLFSRSVSTISD